MYQRRRLITIIVLLIAILGLGIGFAAFSTTLTIKSSASVNPTGDAFSVSFSSLKTSVSTGSLTPTVSYNSNATEAPTGVDATLSGTTISGMKANFTEPGQTVIYKFYVHNTGEYVAYLNEINGVRAVGSSITIDMDSQKKCTAIEGTTQSLVDQVCKNIYVNLIDMSTLNIYTNSSNHNIIVGSNNQLGVNGVTELSLEITYTGTARADGDFNVTFGDITFLYESVDGV